MLKITHRGTGFLARAIEEGLGSFEAEARDVNEVCAVAQHHYGKQGHRYSGLWDDCPFCRLVREENRGA